MKTPIYLLTFLFVSHFVSAQRINVGIGPSFAVGDYGNAEFTNTKASQASIGYCVKASNEFFPGSIITPTVFVFYNSNPMVGGEVEVLLPSVDFVALNPYHQYGGGVGLHIQTRKEGISVGLSGNLGMANYTSASYLLQDMKSANYLKVKPKSILSGVFMVGGFVKIPVAERVSVNVSVDYMWGNIDYGILDVESGGLNFTIPSIGETPFSAVSAQFGFSFNLQRYSRN
jgi:hypothetical protein